MATLGSGEQAIEIGKEIKHPYVSSRSFPWWKRIVLILLVTIIYGGIGAAYWLRNDARKRKLGRAGPQADSADRQGAAEGDNTSKSKSISMAAEGQVVDTYVNDIEKEELDGVEEDAKQK